MLAFDFEQISPTQMGVAALLATVVVIYVASRRQRRPEGGPRRSAAESTELTAQVRTLQGDLGTLISELESLSARLSDEAESRQAKLHELIAQADERIAALQSQVNPPPTGRSIGQAAVGGSTLGPLPTLRSVVAPASKPIPTPLIDDRHQAIYTLADQGLTAVEIAQRTGRAGEIELILNLRPKPASLRRPG